MIFNPSTGLYNLRGSDGLLASTDAYMPYLQAFPDTYNGYVLNQEGQPEHPVLVNGQAVSKDELDKIYYSPTTGDIQFSDNIEVLPDYDESKMLGTINYKYFPTKIPTGMGGMTDGYRRDTYSYEGEKLPGAFNSLTDYLNNRKETFSSWNTKDGFDNWMNDLLAGGITGWRKAPEFMANLINKTGTTTAKGLAKWGDYAMPHSLIKSPIISKQLTRLGIDADKLAKFADATFLAGLTNELVNGAKRTWQDENATPMQKISTTTNATLALLPYGYMTTKLLPRTAKSAVNTLNYVRSRVKSGVDPATALIEKAISDSDIGKRATEMAIFTTNNENPTRPIKIAFNKLPLKEKTKRIGYLLFGREYGNDPLHHSFGKSIVTSAWDGTGKFLPHEAKTALIHGVEPDPNYFNYVGGEEAHGVLYDYTHTINPQYKNAKVYELNSFPRSPKIDVKESDIINRWVEHDNGNFDAPGKNQGDRFIYNSAGHTIEIVETKDGNKFIRRIDIYKFNPKDYIKKWITPDKEYNVKHKLMSKDENYQAKLKEIREQYKDDFYLGYEAEKALYNQWLADNEAKINKLSQKSWLQKFGLQIADNVTKDNVIIVRTPWHFYIE